MSWTTCLKLEINRPCQGRITSTSPGSYAQSSYTYCQVRRLATASSSYPPWSPYRPGDTYKPRFESGSAAWAGNFWPTVFANWLGYYSNNKFTKLSWCIRGVRLAKHGLECTPKLWSGTLKFSDRLDYRIFRSVMRSGQARSKHRELSLKISHLWPTS